MFYVYGSANIDATIFNGTSKKEVRFFCKFLSIYESRKSFCEMSEWRLKCACGEYFVVLMVYRIALIAGCTRVAAEIVAWLCFCRARSSHFDSHGLWMLQFHCKHCGTSLIGASTLRWDICCRLLDNVSLRPWGIVGEHFDPAVLV
jgi:hypothetical protein